MKSIYQFLTNPERVNDYSQLTKGELHSALMLMGIIAIFFVSLLAFAAYRPRHKKTFFNIIKSKHYVHN